MKRLCEFVTDKTACFKLFPNSVQILESDGVFKAIVKDCKQGTSLASRQKFDVMQRLKNAVNNPYIGADVLRHLMYDGKTVFIFSRNGEFLEAV